MSLRKHVFSGRDFRNQKWINLYLKYFLDRELKTPDVFTDLTEMDSLTETDLTDEFLAEISCDFEIESKVRFKIFIESSLKKIIE